MSQESFPGAVTAVAAAGFVGLMSLFNLAGRFIWASLSDAIGRKNTYLVYMRLGLLLYVLVPSAGARGNVVLFVAFFVISSVCMAAASQRYRPICATSRHPL